MDGAYSWPVHGAKAGLYERPTAAHRGAHEDHRQLVSPYVRKVLVCMELKGIDYEVDPITPFFGNDEFRRLSPLCRIPVLIEGDLVLTDSTVIAEYLDEAYPEPPLLPKEPKERARARWLEEFADTRLGDVFIWGLFYPKMVHPRVWGEPGDQARIDGP